VAVMFLRYHTRIKDGKEHRYWDIVENRRCGRGKVVQRQALYLGEINDSQDESWCRTIEVFDENRERTMPLALFPAVGYSRDKRSDCVQVVIGLIITPEGLDKVLQHKERLLSSGRSAWPTVRRGPVGSIFCKPWLDKGTKAPRCL
jgi:hypothetical protein